jgi:hypothetical protein
MTNKCARCPKVLSLSFSFSLSPFVGHLVLFVTRCSRGTRARPFVRLGSALHTWLSPTPSTPLGYGSLCSFNVCIHHRCSGSLPRLADGPRLRVSNPCIRVDSFLLLKMNEMCIAPHRTAVHCRLRGDGWSHLKHASKTNKQAENNNKGKKAVFRPATTRQPPPLSVETPASLLLSLSLLPCVFLPLRPSFFTLPRSCI